jgi:hypothetical protein
MSYQPSLVPSNVPVDMESTELPTDLPSVSLTPTFSEKPSPDLASLSPSVLSAEPSESSSSPQPSSSFSPTFNPSEQEKGQSITPSNQTTLVPSISVAPSISFTPSQKAGIANDTVTLAPSTSLAPSQQPVTSNDIGSSTPSLSLAPSRQKETSDDIASEELSNDGSDPQNTLDSLYIPVDDDGLSDPSNNFSLMVVNTGMDCTRSSLNTPYKQLDHSEYPLLYVQHDTTSTGESNQQIITRQILLRMDLSDQTFPAGTSIVKANLRILSAGVDDPIHVTVHRLLIPWEDTEKQVANGGIFFGFGTKNRNAIPTAHQLLSANGQQAVVEPSVEFFGTQRTLLELDVTDDIKYWVEEKGPNHGWLFLPAKREEGRWAMWGLDSVSKPELWIEYSELA